MFGSTCTYTTNSVAKWDLLFTLLDGKNKGSHECHINTCAQPVPRLDFHRMGDCSDMGILEQRTTWLALTAFLYYLLSV